MGSQMRYHTPLRYPGGKAKLSWLVKDILRDNGLLGGHYVEPYAGGAAVAFELLLGEYVRRVHINDLNDGVFAFWSAVLNHPEDICRRIHDTPISIDVWQEQRRVSQNPRNHSLPDLAFAFFFLNRTNRSGILNAGVIGGINQTGPYKIDARYDKKALIERVQRIAVYASRVRLSREDAESFLERVERELPKNTLVYIDPPYFVQGKRLYDNFYTPDDHVRIAERIARLRLPWMLSYDDHTTIQKLYAGFRNCSITLNYSAARYERGTERLIFSHMLSVPKVLEGIA